MEITCLTKDFYPEYIKNSENSTGRKQTTQSDKGSSPGTGHTPKEVTWMTKQSSSASSVVREMQVAAPMRYPAQLSERLKTDGPAWPVAVEL